MVGAGAPAFSWPSPKRGMGGASGYPNQLPPDQHPPDFVRARANVHQLGISEEPLDGPVFSIASTSQCLDCLQRKRKIKIWCRGHDIISIISSSGIDGGVNTHPMITDIQSTIKRELT